MTVVPDMHHHHPTLGSRMAGNFFSSFHSKRNSPECCDTSTQFTFVSFIKRWASPSFHSYSPVKPACWKTQLWHSASASPKALTEYVAVGESADTKLFSAERRTTHSSVASPPCARSDEARVFEIWPFLCPPARPWSVIWPVRCWVSTWQRSRRHRREWKWKRWARLLIDGRRVC